ncbi:DUF748 domain-containing protein [Undibacterium sp. WLX3042]|uniref:DUF748 domain-containing protein n=1 Tax=Undibacterium sp. WLX3042 TaxID=3412686 RepID=UPI003C2B3A1A
MVLPLISFPSRFQRWRPGHRLAGAVVFVALLMLLSYLFLPVLVKRIAIEQIQQQTGRKLDIGTISFSPFSLALTATDIRLYEADQKTPAVSAQELRVNLSITSLFHRALVLDELFLTAPDVHLVRYSAAQPSRYNVSDVLDKIAASPKSDAPLRFSVANIQISKGTIVFDDQVFGKQFKLTDLQVGLPFISNFPKQADSFVEPRLSAHFNGADFALQARAKPFSATHESTLAIDFDQLDLAQLTPYVPVALPVQVESARLSSKLNLTFSQKKQTEIFLSGDVRLHDVFLKDKQSQPLLKLEGLQARIRQMNLMTTATELQQLSLSAPQVWLDFDAQHGLNWANLQAAPVGKSGVATTAAAGKTSTTTPVVTAATATANPAPLPLVQVQDLQVTNGQIHFSDAVHARPEQKLELQNISLNAQQLSTAKDVKPAQLKLSLETKADEKIGFDGQLQIFSSTLNGKLEISDVALANYQAFLNPFLKANVSGKLDAESGVSLKAGEFQLSDLSLRLRDLLLKGKASDGSIALKSFALNKSLLNSANRTIQMGTVEFDGLRADIRRDKSAAMLMQSWLPESASSASKGNVVRTANAELPPAKSTAAAPWKISLNQFDLKNSEIDFLDQSVTPEVKLNLNSINLNLAQLSSDFSKDVSFRLQSKLNRRAKLNLDGNSSAGMKKVNVNLDTESLPIARLSSYFSQFLNVQIVKGGGTAKGKLVLTNVLEADRQIDYDGMLSLNNFQIFENGTDEDFLDWKAISAEGMHAKIGKSQQLIDVKKLSLNDFFARLVLSDKARLNLQNILVSKAAKDTPVNAAATPKEITAKSSAVLAGKNTVTQKLPVTGTPSSVIMRIGQTVITGGNVNFTDNFIQPNYHANLTGISGSIGTISSDNPQVATVELNGKVDDDAPLLISGSMNPLSTPVFLDIKGSANGIELTKLTPYAAKYAGYAIEKGKLSAQASYKIENQQLTAENELRLDQLTFGERVDSPSATKLPVMLAVALLRDNQGGITINLPISGSLSDPQFSVGSIIFKVFVNIITKAVTSPFALLGSIFGGGGEELAYLEFNPGSAALTPAATEKLDHLAKALKERASLRLDITGRVEVKSDTEGVKREMLESRLREAKWRELGRKNRGIKSESLTLTADERHKFLQALYDAAKFTKPRNMLGLAKTLPDAEAEQLLLQNLTVDTDDLRELAQRRADAVRDYLEDVAQVGRERMFLIAPKLNSDGIKDKGAPNRVDFSLK